MEIKVGDFTNQQNVMSSNINLRNLLLKLIIIYIAIALLILPANVAALEAQVSHFSPSTSSTDLGSFGAVTIVGDAQSSDERIPLLLRTATTVPVQGRLTDNLGVALSTTDVHVCVSEGIEETCINDQTDANGLFHADVSFNMEDPHTMHLLNIWLGTDKLGEQLITNEQFFPAGGPQGDQTINGDLTVTGSATVSGQNVCLADGTNCPAGASGDITGVTAGDGLIGGGLTGDVTLNIQSCPDGQILKTAGGVWTCANDDQGSFTDTNAETICGTGTYLDGDGNCVAILSYPGDCPNDQVRINGACEPVPNCDVNTQKLMWDTALDQFSCEIDALGSGSDNWGSQVVQSDATLTGDGTSGNGLSVVVPSCPGGQVLTGNGAAFSCVVDTAGDADSVVGNEVLDVTVDAPLSRTGSVATGYALDVVLPTCLASEVLTSTDGQNFVCQTDQSGAADNWGTQSALTAGPLTGDGTAGNPLDINLPSCNAGEMLASTDGNAVTCAVDQTGTADNWGTQSALTAGPLTGDGTIGTPIDITLPTCLAGEVLTTTDGQTFTCQTDQTGSTDGDWNINGNDISNANSGNVGIGTTTPQSELEIENSAFHTNVIIDAADDFDATLQLQEAGAPHWYINNDGDDGDKFEIRSTGEIERLTITKTGEVGIGTTNPQELLHLESPSPKLAFTDQGQPNQHWIVRAMDTAAQSHFLIQYTTDFSTIVDYLTVRNTGAVGIGDSIPDASLLLDVEGQVGATEYCDEDGNNCQPITALGGSSLWSQSGSDVYRASDNVGIGTPNPQEDLHVSSATPRIAITDTDSSTRSWAIRSQDNGADADFIIQYSDNNFGSFEDRLLITEDGKVGIGTSTPQAEMEVENASSTTTFMLDSGSDHDSMIQLDENNVQKWRFGSRGTSNDEFEMIDENNNSRLTLLQTGEVGIGTSTPDVELEIENNADHSNLAIDAADDFDATIQFREAGNELWYINNDGNESDVFEIRSTGGVERLTILQSGEVGIGVTNPSTALEVDGTIEVTATNDVCIQGGNCLSTSGGAADNWGTQTAVTSGPLTGDGTPGTPIDITLPSCAANEMLQSVDGNTIACAVDQGADSDWVENAGDVYRLSGNVGIGAAPPTDRLTIFEAGTTTSAIAVTGQPHHSGPNHYPIIDVEDQSTACNGCDLIGQRIILDDTSATSRKYGIHATATGGQFNYGVYGATVSGANNYAGYFDGRVTVASALGVGTNTTTANLHVEDTSSSVDLILESSGDAIQRISFSDDNTEWAYIENQVSSERLKIGTNLDEDIVFTLNGVDQVIIDDTGDVAIGSTVPSGSLKLDVTGNVGATAYCDQNGNNCHSITSLADDNDWRPSGNNIYSVPSGNVGVGTGGTPDGKLEVRQNGAGDVFNLYDGSTNVFTVNSAGNVGINLPSPSHDLDIIGTSRILAGEQQTALEIGSHVGSERINVSIAESSIASGSNQRIGIDVNTLPSLDAKLGFFETTSGSPSFTSGVTVSNNNSGANHYAIYAQDGKSYFGDEIGIGTTSPFYQLAARNPSGDSIFSLEGSDSATSAIVMYTDGDGGATGVYSPTNDAWAISGSGVSHGVTPNKFHISRFDGATQTLPLRITPNGNVGIGRNADITWDPATELEVKGVLTLDSASGSSEGGQIGWGSASDSWVQDIDAFGRMRFFLNTPSNKEIIIFNSHGTGKANVILSDGDITLSNGQGFKPGGGSWAASSDERLKTRVQNLVAAVETLEQLRPVSFEWINPEEHRSGIQAGFIAQEVEELFPDWVDEKEVTGKDTELVEGAAKTISLPHDFDALVVKAIQEQQDQIEDLEQQNQELRALICLDHPDASVCN